VALEDAMLGREQSERRNHATRRQTAEREALQVCLIGRSRR
jgi:hypothetical protein